MVDMDDIDDGKDINILDTITKQGREFLGGISDKTVEAFGIAPKTTQTNESDLDNLTNLKLKFENELSNYASLRQVIGKNASEHVTLNDENSREYKNFINKNFNKVPIKASCNTNR